MNPKHIKKMYYRYLVKNPFLYYAYLIIWSGLILAAVQNIEIDIVDTYLGMSSENRILINERIDYSIEEVYVYKSKNKETYKYNIVEVENIENNMMLLVADKDISLDGNVYIDIISDKAVIGDIVAGNRRKYITQEDRNENIAP